MSEMRYTVNDIFFGQVCAEPERGKNRFGTEVYIIMAFFEDLGKKITETSQSAAQKTKNLAEVTKLNSQVNDLNKSLAGLYQEIGKQYYEKTKEAPEEEFSGLFQQIAETNEKLDGTKEQIRTLKGITICGNCNAEVPAGQKFCSNCGSRIVADDPVQAPEEKKNCPLCGAEVKEGQKFCNKCGSQL